MKKITMMTLLSPLEFDGDMIITYTQNYKPFSTDPKDIDFRHKFNVEIVKRLYASMKEIVAYCLGDVSILSKVLGGEFATFIFKDNRSLHSPFVGKYSYDFANAELFFNETDEGDFFEFEIMDKDGSSGTVWKFPAELTWENFKVSDSEQISSIVQEFLFYS